MELQPDLGQTHAYLIFLYLHRGHDREALEHARDVVTRLPQDPWALNAAGIAELMAGEIPRSRNLFDRVFPIYRGTRGYRDSGAGIETHLASLRLRDGRPGEAEALLEESLATDRRVSEAGNQDWSMPFDVACVHALRGEKDEAFQWLDKAVEAGWAGWPLGTRSPLLDSLRTDPRMRELETRLESLVRKMRRRAGLN